MKTKILLFTFSLFVGFIAKGQIPNHSFENWTGYYIDNWPCTNSLIVFGNPQSVYKSADAHDGSFACELYTLRIKTKPGGIFVPDYAGSAFVGDQIQTKSVPGFPFTEKPSHFRFWYKVNGRNNDSANVYVLLTKWNASKGEKDTISTAICYLHDSVGVYTKMRMALQIRDSSAVPDTAIIYISAATIYATKEGSRFLIDDMAFEGGTMGFETQTNDIDLEVYPNPITHGKLNLRVNSPVRIDGILLKSIRGEVLTRLDYEPSQALELNLAPGIYFIELESINGVFIRKLVVQ